MIFRCDLPPPQFATYTLYSNFRWTAPDGTTRTFSPIRTESDPKNCDQGNIPAGDAFADDSSGYHLYVTNFNQMTVFGPDGTQVYPTWLDTNGNSFSLDGNSNLVDTLGRTPVLASSAGNQQFYDVLTSQGGTQRVTVTLTGITISTAFGQGGVTEYPPTVVNAPSSVSLPDGSSYLFGYDSYGELTSLTLPTGAQITFGYTNFADSYGNTNRWVSSRVTPAGTWSFTPQVISTCPIGGQNCQQSVTLGKPGGDSILYTFTMNGGAWATQTQYLESGGALLSTLVSDYDLSNTCSGCTGAAYVRTLRQTVSLPTVGGATVSKKTEYQFDGPQTGNLIAVKEWAFYSGGFPANPDRETDTTYQALGSNIINRLASITIKNAAGSQVSQTLFSYDQSALASVTGITHHDDVNYGTGRTVRGNPTTIQKWIAGTTYSTTALTYDTTGQLRQSTDPKGNISTFAYDDRFFNDNGANPPAAVGPPAGPTNAYVTTITVPVIGSATMGYYFGSGKQAAVTDQNNAASYSHYTDILDRPTQSVDAAGGWTQLSYTGSTQTDAYTGITDATPSTSCSSCRHGQNILDSLGRLLRTALVNDPDGQTTVDYGYDLVHRTNSTSNPHRSGAATTDGTTTNSYDGLGRTVQTTRPDGNAVGYAFGASVGTGTAQACDSSTYGTGFPSLSTDETGRKRLFWTDGFGRMIEVDEPNSSGALSVATCYQYNALDLLALVQQRGGTTDTTQWRTRTYAYDGLGRLLQEVTPENSPNGIRFDYGNGAPCSGDPQLPCTRTDARNFVTTYTYDALNRLTGKSYSDGTTAGVQYFYDQTLYNGLNISNGKGRRTGMSDGSGSTAWSYDAAGRIAARRQTIGNLTKSITYSYNRDGSVASVTYPSGRVVSYSYNNAQQPTGATDGTRKFVSSAHYAAPALLTSAINGAVTGWNAITQTNTFNNRLQPTRLQAVSPVPLTLRDFSYGYDQGSGHNNGNVVQIANNRDTTRTITYGYDQLNRVSSAQTSVWGDTFGYDPWANLLSKTVTLGTAETLSVTVNSKNQITGFTYDTNGNLTWDGVNALRFDSENRAIPVSGGTYTYDGDDRRVQRPDGTTYWLDDDRRPLSVGDNTGAISRDYIFFAGQMVAFVGITSGNTYYYLSDHLGSARVVASGDGKAIMWDADYYPFGGQRIVTNNLTNFYRFTGYEYDSGTGYYNANYRYESSNIGRFMSPDPVEGSPDNPQSWNRYTYALDNPTNLVDPLGLCEITVKLQDPNTGNIYVICADPIPGSEPSPPGKQTLANWDDTHPTAGQRKPPVANNGTLQTIKNIARTIGSYIPTLCGAGGFAYAGPRLSGALAAVGVYGIGALDSRTGGSKGVFH